MKEDMVGGEGMLAGKLVGGNEEGTGPERGQRERGRLLEPALSPLGSLDSGGHRRVLRMRHCAAQWLPGLITYSLCDPGQAN